MACKSDPNLPGSIGQRLKKKHPNEIAQKEDLGSSTTERLHFDFSLSCIGEGNGNQLQCSCLENPRDRGAWWAAVYGGHTESDTTEVT